MQSVFDAKCFPQLPLSMWFLQQKANRQMALFQVPYRPVINAVATYHSLATFSKESSFCIHLLILSIPITSIAMMESEDQGVDLDNLSWIFFHELIVKEGCMRCPASYPINDRIKTLDQSYFVRGLLEEVMPSMASIGLAFCFNISITF